MTDGFGKADGDERDMAFRQDGKLYPLGQALRATYDADNHATLGKHVTGLMLDLAQVPFEPHEFQPIVTTLTPPPRPSWLARVRSALPRALKRSRRP
ncbi:hypothetical protein FHT00_002350 [Sphingomonas insulae]|uniref:Uncharacterized protein n=1 Tax=Sphingomonas insulae TaxID=424800 RepID=A0ABN1HKQ6_9SPHN|nr:hypothetical protein [Sphingomonas insulae]NIJ30387.1 hypothetical protein [Sphingomonas insulae]